MTSFALIAFLALSALVAGAVYRGAQQKPSEERRVVLGRLGVFLGIAAIVVACGFGGQLAVMFLTLAVSGRGAYELYGSLRKPSAAFRTGVCTGYVLLGLALLCFAIILPGPAAVFTYLVVAAFEGVREFAPPRAGVAVAGGAALLVGGLFFTLTGAGLGRAVLLAAPIAASAFMGDVVVTWIKSRSEIESFGRLLPGNMGVLDRFAALFFAAPVAILALSR